MIPTSPSHVSTLALLGCALLFSAACTGQVVSESDSSAGGGSGTGTGPTTTASEGGGGSGGAGAGGTVCVEAPQGAGGFKEPACADLAKLTISDPIVLDANADGKLEAGETATLQVTLAEVAGVGFNAYPGVQFATSTPGVTVSSDNWLYAILACQVDTMNAGVTVDPDVAPGTVVTIHAQIAMLGGPCPDAPSIDIPILIH